MNLLAMRGRAAPLHAGVAEVLRQRIVPGEPAADARLPAPRELAEVLGAARLTAVQATSSLEDEGLVERHSGRGAILRQVQVTNRVSLQMKAEPPESHAMLEQLEDLA